MEGPEGGLTENQFRCGCQNNTLSAAAVCRDHKGELIAIRICQNQGSDPMKGEAIAARLVSAMAEEFHNRDIIIEGDSLILVNQAVSQSGLHSYLAY